MPSFRAKHSLCRLFGVFRTAWSTAVTRFRPILQEARSGLKLLPVPMSTPGGWHPDEHRSVLVHVDAIVSRSMVVFEMAETFCSKDMLHF